MNLRTCGIVYFPCSNSLLHYRSKRTLLDDLRAQRAGEILDERSFTLPKHLPYESLSFRALKTIIALYRACFYSRHSFVIEITLKHLAKKAMLSERHAGLALRELEAASLISSQKIWHTHTEIVLLDPDGKSGTPLYELGDRNLQAFKSQPAWYWYDLLLYGGKGIISKPHFPVTAKDMFAIRAMGGGNKVKLVAECPFFRTIYAEDNGVRLKDRDGNFIEKLVLCSGNTSKDRKKFRITFYKDGTDRWHCFRCGQGGTCKELWLRLYPRFRREQLNPPATVYVSGKRRARSTRTQRATASKSNNGIRSVRKEFDTGT